MKKIFSILIFIILSFCASPIWSQGILQSLFGLDSPTNKWVLFVWPVIVIPGIIIYLIQVFWFSFLVPSPVRAAPFRAFIMVFVIDLISALLTFGCIFTYASSYNDFFCFLIVSPVNFLLTVFIIYLMYKEAKIPITANAFMKNILVGLGITFGILLESILAFIVLCPKM